MKEAQNDMAKASNAANIPMQLDKDYTEKAELSYLACVQCGRCSAGCPVAFESEHTPRNIIRLIQLGLWKEACQSPFIWMCASCYTCTVRCPRGVKIAEVMLHLRRLSFEKNWITPGEKLVFYKSFLNMVKEKRKINELSLGLSVGLRSFPPAHPMEDAILLLKMLKRGKLR